MEYLQEYGVYLLRIITTVVAILITAAGLFAIASKSKDKAGEKIKIKSLNKKYQELAKAIAEKVLDKKALKKYHKALKSQKDKKNSKHVYVLQFDGDIKASPVSHLRQEVTALLALPFKPDEVVICIESPGGGVPHYGLAASQLERITSAGIPLTACVDKVAASGGYLMAAVADKILAAPFAIIGSIGVVAQLPNFNRFLKKHDIDYEQITAGQFKRTLSLFGENTDDGRKKFQEDIEDIHVIFKQAVKHNRPAVDIDAVATGEHWLAKQALQYRLVDELCTSDDYLLNLSKTTDIYEISYTTKKTLLEKLTGNIQQACSQLFSAF